MRNDQGIAVSGDRSEILAWLSPLEPHLRHHDIRTNRVQGVGDWLLRMEEFQSWKNGDGQSESKKATIFCSGNLGVGKTYISSLVIDALCDEPGEAGEDNCVACFYFDSTAQKEQSAANVLGALLRQVIGGFDQIPKEITDAFRRHKKLIGGRELQLPEIVKMLRNFSSTRRTFFCLDALDECAAPHRAKILLALKDIIKLSPTGRVFLTGRPYVGDEVRKHFPGGTAFVSISPRNDDIIRFIHTRLAEDTTSGEMDEGLEAEIVKKIPEVVSAIFLLVSLNLGEILQETTIHRRRESLQVLTTGLHLEDAYGATLERIKAEGCCKSRLGTTALMWICHSERPLGAEELCHALAVEIGSTDYDADNVPSIQTVLSCCQGLAVVDKGGSTVRLIHYTLQGYLISNLNLFLSPHSTIAEVCLTHLKSKQVMALSDHWAQPSPFLEYASLYWGAHMNKDLSEEGKRLALELFSHYKYHISISLLSKHMLRCIPLNFSFLGRRFTGLHYASIFGLVEVAKALIKMGGVDINCRDGTDATPLSWASMKGQEGVVELLLGRDDLNPDSPNCDDRTPLMRAAEHGREAVVGLLLGRKGVNPDKTSSMDGKTPIFLAALNGHEGVVRLLLGRTDVNPNRPYRNGQTLMSWAAQNGHEVVVKLLVQQKDVNPDTADMWGQTPISLAAENGHEAVVGLLLQRKDGNPDKPDEDRRTPISLAARNGHWAIVKMLLGREDVSPDKPGMWRRTPISLAAENGREAVVRLLLGREDVNPDKKDRWRQTPLFLAAENGHEVVVKLLLQRKDVNPVVNHRRSYRTEVSFVCTHFYCVSNLY